MSRKRRMSWRIEDCSSSQLLAIWYDDNKNFKMSWKFSLLVWFDITIILILLRGGLVDGIYDPQGICKFPYEGNLCNKCVNNYAKFGCKFYANNLSTLLKLWLLVSTARQMHYIISDNLDFFSYKHLSYSIFSGTTSYWKHLIFKILHKSSSQSIQRASTPKY